MVILVIMIPVLCIGYTYVAFGEVISVHSGEYVAPALLKMIAYSSMATAAISLSAILLVIALSIWILQIRKIAPYCGLWLWKAYLTAGVIALLLQSTAIVVVTLMTSKSGVVAGGLSFVSAVFAFITFACMDRFCIRPLIASSILLTLGSAIYFVTYFS